MTKEEFEAKYTETYKWQCLGRVRAYIDMLEMLESTQIVQR